jgi:hypothetical protein
MTVSSYSRSNLYWYDSGPAGWLRYQPCPYWDWPDHVEGGW